MTELAVMKSHYDIHCISGDEDVIIAFCYNQEIAQYIINVLAGQKWDTPTMFYFEEIKPVDRISKN